jgi:hypothetical protein
MQMRVKCINTPREEGPYGNWLTLGKIYEVVRIAGTQYEIVCNNGIGCWWHNSRFIIIDDKPICIDGVNWYHCQNGCGTITKAKICCGCK